MHCIKFIKKGTEETVELDEVDKLVCEALGKEYNPKKWCYLGEKRVEGVDWYNTVAFALALGKTIAEVKELWKDCDEIIKICEMIEAKFVPESYYQR